VPPRVDTAPPVILRTFWLPVFRHINVALAIDGDRVWINETRSCARAIGAAALSRASGESGNYAGRGHLAHGMVAAVGDINVAGAIHGDAGGIEEARVASRPIGVIERDRVANQVIEDVDIRPRCAGREKDSSQWLRPSDRRAD